MTNFNVDNSTYVNLVITGDEPPVVLTMSASGAVGPQGPTGPTGPATSLSIGNVSSGESASATLTGPAGNQVLSLVLPRGEQGLQGVQGNVGPIGPAASLSIGNVTYGETAAATLAGTPPNQVLSLTLPRGEQGVAGPATTVQVGSTVTGNAGTNASVTSTTSGNTLTLNFTIPRGSDATMVLADETPQPLGVASPGTALSAARADHVHAVPAIHYTSLVNVPLTFAPSPHQHVLNDVTGLQLALDSKQPVGNYATLDGSGKIPSSILPSYVDDVAEYADLAGFPATGEVGKIYVARDTNKTFRWSGSTYVEISASPGSTDAVPEGSVNLYFTASRAALAAPIQSLNSLTGDLNIAGGGNVTVTANSSTITISADAGVGPDDPVDGGDYIGQLLYSITFTSQPQSQTLTLGGIGTWSSGSNVPANSSLLTVADKAMLVTLVGPDGLDPGYLSVKTSSNAANVASSSSTLTLNGAFPAANVTPIGFELSSASNGTRAMLLSHYRSGTTTMGFTTAWTSDDNGSSWQIVANLPFIYRVASTESNFVGTSLTNADDKSSNVCYQSTDALNWNERSLPANDTWHISGGGSLFVAVGQFNNTAAYSANGFSWTSATPPIASGLLGIAYGNGRHVAISGSNSYVTTNGTSWTSGNLPSSGYGSISYQGNRFIALRSGVTTTDVATSADGITWSLGSLPTAGKWRWTAYAGGSYAALPGEPLTYTGYALATATGSTSGSASFTVNALSTSGASVSYQWQVSVDSGVTWSNIANATSATLSLTGLSTGDTGKRYRVAVSAAGVSTAYSQSATLTVTG